MHHKTNIDMENELTKLLRMCKKSFDDVLYVAYATYDEQKKTQCRYHCSIEDYMQVIANIPSIYELPKYYDIAIVGEDWWIDYDYRGDPHIHISPQKPHLYNAMKH